jgi:predicted MFS family arabinose efflux permease
MSTAPERKPRVFSVFTIRSYRFQWSADLLTSWAFEMELLILGWYVLVTTDSAFLLSVVAALQYGGTLLSPFFGVIADRVNRRSMLITLRASYAALALTLACMSAIGDIPTWLIFTIAGLGGLIRPSDLVVRNSLIADTVPVRQLRDAMGLSRTTMDSARILGALLGAGLLSSSGLAVAYGGVTTFYVLSIALAFGIASRAAVPVTAKPWAELKSGLRYMGDNRVIVGIVLLAFLVNLTAFPLSHGLLPVVARDIYAVDENGLAQLVASFAFGALVGSLITALAFRGARPGRTVAINVFIWYALLIGLGYTTSHTVGMGLLVLVGAAQSFGMISMSVLLLSTTESAYRGRVQGVRMLSVYGLPIGLLVGGALIERYGVASTFTVYGIAGIIGMGAILKRWPQMLNA